MAKRNKEIFSMKHIMGQVLKENKLTKGIQQLNAQDAWGDMMGPGVATYTESVTIQGKTLIVKLTSSALREELSYGKANIIKMMNDALGEKVISRIILG
ncbi:MAG: RNA-binding protein [Flavobacteriaceae bacterium]|nr:MAG: RNA-binding protein [Flavobacteriaceae bacterium]